MVDVNRRVLKWNIPVDDRWHPVGNGAPLLVACQNGHDVVQVWTDELDADNVRIRSARVFGTGQRVPADTFALGSVVAGPLVWHVFMGDPA